MVKKEHIKYIDFVADCKRLAKKIHNSGNYITTLVAITRGGLAPVSVLSQYLNIKDIRTISLESYSDDNKRGQIRIISKQDIPDKPSTLFVDDLIDSGETALFIKKEFPHSRIATVYTKKEDFPLDYKAKKKRDIWLCFPWEVDVLEGVEEKQKEFARKLEERKAVFGLTDSKSNEELKEEFVKNLKEKVKQVTENLNLPSFQEKEEELAPLPDDYIPMNVDSEYIGTEGFPLTKEQKEIIKEIEETNDPVTVLTGRAGSGKSTIIKNLLHRHPHWQICATTGRAAILVGGSTVDSFFAYDRSLNTCFSRDVLKANMKATSSTIIVDEASMIGSSMFDYIYSCCQEFNKRLLLVGDWGQASPVKEEWITKSKNWKDYKVLHLTENFRQKDSQFLDMLDKIRLGIKDETIDSLLKSRICPQIPLNDLYTKLFYTNNQVTKYNNVRVRECSIKTGNEAYYFIPDVIDNPAKFTDEQLRTIFKNSMFSFNEPLCVNCRVVIVKNGGREYVNGDTGELVEITDDYLQVLLDRTGGLVKIVKQTIELRNPKGKLLLSFKGFPVRAGYALTIHKCQGMTLPKAWIDFHGLSGRHIHGIGYVALSRVRCLKDLLVSNWNNDLIHCDKQIENLL